jgi:dGTPase
MLTWGKLLNQTRRKELSGNNETLGTGINRTEFERDYDRILFATPTRRLADKTQVFPMEENDSVRNRLTHSHEVSNLARSIGVRLAFDHADQVFGEFHEQLQVKRNVPSLLAAVGLAHDLGNPPFGHQGEVAMQEWFNLRNTNQEIDIDFVKFDGNAQTFRLLTRLQVLNDQFGLNLTVGTLAALLKYPSVYGSTEMGGFKKHGIFNSEKEIVGQVWEQTGLSAGVRHPLAYVMEACDDIAYSIIDAEDTIKKGYASFYDLIDFLESTNDDDVTKDVISTAKAKNIEFKRENLSSRELNDISMQMFRVKAIAVMVNDATDVFVKNVPKMMSGEIEAGFELIKKSNCAHLCKTVKSFDLRFGFQHKDVLKLELKGSNYITSMMDMVWSAIQYPNSSAKPFERFVFGEISENYRRVYESSDKSLYNQYQLLCDVVSGMTENYLINKHDLFVSLKNAASKATSS